MFVGGRFFHAVIIWLALFQAAFSTCPSGTKLFNLSDGTQDCKFCSDCPRGSVKVHNCSIYKDTVCKPACENGDYYVDSEPHCRKCTACEPGQYIVRNCSQFDDSMCEECPEGSFSANHNSTSCIKCDGCEDKGIGKACTSTTDSVCKDKSQTIIVGIVICVIVVLVLAIVLFVVLWRRRILRRGIKRSKDTETQRKSSEGTRKNKGTGKLQEMTPLMNEDEHTKAIKQQIMEIKRKSQHELKSLTRKEQLKKLSLCVCKLTRPTSTDNVEGETGIKDNTENTQLTDHLSNENQLLQHKDKEIKHKSNQIPSFKTTESKATMPFAMSSEEYHEPNESQPPQDEDIGKLSASDKKPSSKTEKTKNTKPSNIGNGSNKKCPSQDKEEEKTPTSGHIGSTKTDKSRNTNPVEVLSDTGQCSNTDQVPQDEETGKESTCDQITSDKTEKSNNTMTDKVSSDKGYISDEKPPSRDEGKERKHASTKVETSNDKMPLDKEGVANENHRSQDENKESKLKNDKQSSIFKRITPPTSDKVSKSKTKTSMDTMPDKVSPDKEKRETPVLKETTNERKPSEDLYYKVGQFTATFVGSEYLITSYAALKLILGSTTGTENKVSDSHGEICIEYYEKVSKVFVEANRAFEIVYKNDTLNVAVLQLKKPVDNNQSFYLCSDRSAENETKCQFLTGILKFENVDVTNTYKYTEVSKFLNENLRDFENDLEQNGKSKICIENYKKCVAISGEHSNSYLCWTSENHISSGSPGIFFSDVDQMFNMHCVATTQCPPLYDFLSEHLRGKFPAKYRLQIGTYMCAVYDDMKKRNPTLTEALFF